MSIAVACLSVLFVASTALASSAPVAPIANLVPGATYSGTGQLTAIHDQKPQSGAPQTLSTQQATLELTFGVAAGGSALTGVTPSEQLGCGYALPATIQILSVDTPGARETVTANGFVIRDQRRTRGVTLTTTIKATFGSPNTGSVSFDVQRKRGRNLVCSSKVAFAVAPTSPT
jgi:hypothetical protein